MSKKMYSFRLDENLINSAKKAAKKMDISLSAFISYSLREKLGEISNDKSFCQYLIVNREKNNPLKEIAIELKRLRMQLRKLLKT